MIRRYLIGVVASYSALELPADDGDLEDRAGAGGGQYGDLEAVGANATTPP